MTYDVHAPEYFRPDALEAELRRVADVCHSCRLCFNLCPSFPALFDFIDQHEERGDGEVEALTEGELRRVVDLCYNCKLCYPKCPYTPPHKFNIDFPALMLRAKAVRAKQEGVALQDRVLGRPDVLGKLGCAGAPLSNLANDNPALRVLMSKTVGIHPEFNLPRFASLPFERWFRRAQRERGALRVEPKARVALFVTCSLNYNDVPPAQALTQVLWHNDVEVVLPQQRCCGMPLLDGGDVDACTDNARANVAAFAPWVERGYDVVVPSPTCSYVLKQDYPTLLASEDAARIAARTYDLCEYLVRLHGEGKLRRDFRASPGRVGYHLPCHLKVQNIGTKSADLLRLIPGADVEVVEKCSAVDGTWGMKTQYYALSQKQAQKLYNGLRDAHADVYASDCPLSRLQIAHGTGRPAFHPVELLRDAYGIAAPGSGSAGP